MGLQEIPQRKFREALASYTVGGIKGSVGMTLVSPAFHGLLQTRGSDFHDIFFMGSHFLV